MSSPSKKRLQDAFNLSDTDAARLKKALSAGGDRWGIDHKAVDKALDLADSLIGGYGVESIEGSYVDRYYQSIVALYVNTGDTYSTTLLFETSTGNWKITTMGDWVEVNERKYDIY